MRARPGIKRLWWRRNLREAGGSSREDLFGREMDVRPGYRFGDDPALDGQAPPSALQPLEQRLDSLRCAFAPWPAWVLEPPGRDIILHKSHALKLKEIQNYSKLRTV
jgi:hypothetical protein